MKKAQVTAVIGGQWGDEGKGKIVDYLAASADVVIRSQGGDNAGHTVINEHGKFGLHLVPAGIFNPKTINIIGAGVALNPKSLLAELAELDKRGIDTARLVISPKAHLAFDYHRFIDASQEDARGAARIDTTKRGIGPTYMDKAERVGLPARLLLEPKRLLEELGPLLAAKRRRLESDDPVLFPQHYEALVREAAIRLGPLIQDTEIIIEDHLAGGSRFVLEGAHGALLDLDHGTYPMVTASNSTVGGLLTGAGLPPLALTRVVGVFKAYQTRVGAGGMPTEITDELADTIREVGHEFGTTTGRPRRIGWFDGVAARYAHRINGFTDIAITKVDTLADIGDIKTATSYRRHGHPAAGFQPDNRLLAEYEPVYETIPGWTTAELAGLTSLKPVPALEQFGKTLMRSFPGARLSYVGVGREREQLIAL